MRKAVIFDFDGVIADTLPALEHCYDQFLLSFEIEGDQNDFSLLNGKNLDEIIDYIKTKYLPEEEKTILKARYHVMLNKELQACSLIEGVRPVLIQLKKHGISLLIASSAHRKYICDFLKKNNILSYFDTIISGEDVKKAKPEPDIYLLAKSKMEAEEYFVVEDSDNGLCAARRANVTVVFFNQYLRKSSVDVSYEINRMEQLVSFVMADDIMLFPGRNINVTLCKKEFILDNSTKQRVEELWNTRENYIWNGKILAVSSFSLENDVVNMRSYFVEYKYLYAKLRDKELTFPLIPIAVSGILCDSNQRCVLAKRKMTTEYSGKYEVISAGGLENRIEQGVVLYREQLLNEVEEEVGINRKDLRNLLIQNIGVAYDPEDHIYDICLKLTFEGDLTKLKYTVNAEYEQDSILIINIKNWEEELRSISLVDTTRKILQTVSQESG